LQHRIKREKIGEGGGRRGTPGKIKVASDGGNVKNKGN
jgi:hypothetical protein